MYKGFVRAGVGLCILTLTVSLFSGCSKREDTGERGSSNSSQVGSTGEAVGEASGKDFGKIDIPALDGSLCGAPIYIAYEKGFFKEEGIDANLTAADFETRKIGLNNGNIPFVNGDFQFFSSAEQGIDMKVIAGMHKGCIKIIKKKGSSITKPSDLEGKKIGVDEIGGTTYQVASVWLEEGGVSAKQEDGKVSFLPYSDGNLELQALYDGEIDAAAVWDPLGDIAVNSNQAEVLIDIAKDEPFAGKYCCFYYASEKVLKENPEEIKALLRAVQKAQKWINENTKEALQIIVDKNYSQVEDTEIAEQLIKDYDYKSSSDEAEKAGMSVKNDVEFFAEKLHEIGYLEADPKEFSENLLQEIEG